MHLPRLRLRTLLIAVAVAGLALGGWTTWKRREYCLEKALECDASVKLHDTLARYSTDFVETTLHAEEVRQLEGIPWPESYRRMMEGKVARAREGAALDREAAARKRGLAARYRHVARYPWLPIPRESEPSPVEPDSP